jgi:hypothetical protein
LRLSLAAISAVGLIYLGVAGALQLVARSIERTGEVYPYKQEDWLRYLVPTLWPTEGKPLLLLTGSSTVREGLLVEEFTAAFPEYRTFQGGISGGTLGDVLASLSYVERAYGAAALPAVMVVAFSLRFTAEIPTERPFAMGLERYSAHYRVPVTAPVGLELEAKPKLAGAIDHARFMVLKQHGRYETIRRWLVVRLVSPALDAQLRQSGLSSSSLARLLLPWRAHQVGVRQYAAEQLSPYKYRGAGQAVRSMLMQGLDHGASWQKVWRWDPAGEGAAVRARLAQLIAFAERHHIELYALNLPEGSPNRVRYAPGQSEAYRALLDTALDTVPLLDLRCLLEDDEFIDAEHAILRGARRVTERVLGFMKDVRAAREAGDSNFEVRQRIADRYAADGCPEKKPQLHAAIGTRR